MTGAEFSGVDIDLLADYIGGALEGTPEESAVAARIADDPEWHAAHVALSDDIAFVAAELGRIEPEPMPADVVARLDAALGSATRATADHPPAQSGFLDRIARGADTDAAPAASHLTLVAGAPAGGDVPDPVPEKAPAPRHGRRLRWAAPIAVAAGVIAFVGFGLDYLAGRSTGSNTDASSSAGLAKQDPHEPRAPLARSPLGPGQMLASGTDYTHGTLGTAPAQIMTAPFASTPDRKSAPNRGAEGGSGLQRLAGPAALDSCLTAIEQANAGGPLTVESVDYAHFSGAPAVIVRFRADNGHWAWASGADCGTPAGGAATLDKVPVG